ncbi:hypothetical protein [Parasedimentitalea psychrophila]|uniref:Uncharacterized protein n=1 Tax=Parasedimentitalea psychrophila TaxID=2997337 RepID=A0A9Y2KVD0_9RHOB|nr:hypothetical protein [Parasedimentitalea psychrophila]WIY23368.1 hypothetical protein QPJ95_11895 [Parasedimentitalea psychrophila]
MKNEIANNVRALLGVEFFEFTPPADPGSPSEWKGTSLKGGEFSEELVDILPDSSDTPGPIMGTAAKGAGHDEDWEPPVTLPDQANDWDIF